MRLFSLGLLLLPPSLAQLDDLAFVPTTYLDGMHSSRSIARGSAAPPVEAWSTPGITAEYYRFGCGPLVGRSGDLIVFDSIRGAMFALNGSSGGVLWSSNTSRPHDVCKMVLSPEALIYFDQSLNAVVALRLGDGSTLWTYSGGGLYASRPILTSTNLLVVFPFSTPAQAINVSTGSVVWTAATSNQMWGRSWPSPPSTRSSRWTAVA